MKKIVIMIILLVIIVAGFSVAFWPKEKSISIKLYVRDEGITDKNFNEFIAENKGKHVYYFCDARNDDCQFINNTVLKALAENLLVEELLQVFYVDLSAANTNTSAKFKRQWGFTQYPAFAIIDSTVNPYIIIDSLGFSYDAPFDSEDVKNWLIRNNIWQLWQKNTR